jgi:hypothetical protein
MGEGREGGPFMHYNPFPTSPSERRAKQRQSCKGKINDRFWGRSNFNLEGDGDFDSNIEFAFPQICTLIWGKVGKGVKNNLPNIGWNKTLRVFGPGLCPSDAKVSIHTEPITSGARPLGSSCNDPHPASPERARRSGKGRGGDEQIPPKKSVTS